ncbi:hypothetical protein OCU04_002612 [Sclerotinia nivalis]|uniref:Uncharacterized protein n=1 Tax=Sclerotinia nivalis TaxID=352851 RepID=A0A9X0AU45_9HELO|nr:hypothetical protein OCU04_002612 [Sclerotinia nivalis]
MNQARLKYHRSLWSGGSPPALLEVLISRRGSKASDLRDMIFGHDAVTGHICPRTIHRKWPILHNWKSLYYMTHVDYTQSVEDVYTRAAVYSACFDSPNGIRRLLYHAATKASHVKRDGLPSWVPDWALDLSDVQNPCWPFSNDPMNLVDIPLADEFNCGYIPASRYILTFFYRNTTYELEIVEHTSQLEIDGSQSPLNKVVYGYYRHPNQKKA